MSAISLKKITPKLRVQYREDKDTILRRSEQKKKLYLRLFTSSRSSFKKIKTPKRGAKKRTKIKGKKKLKETGGGRTD